MPDENVADFCTACGTPNTRKKQFCSECGASLLKGNNVPQAAPPQPVPVTGVPEKKRNTTVLIAGGAILILLLVVAVYASGIVGTIAPQSAAKNIAAPQPAGTGQPPAGSLSAAATAATGSYPQAGTAGKTTTTLSNGITITYPSDWEKEIVSETSLRDYGRVTTNIANFYSPDITSDRAYLAQPNIDKSSYTTLSIDIDPNPVTDFEQYFNLVTIALQNHYGHIDITKHNYQLKISPGDNFEGYRSYQMDFDTKDMRGSYIFTNVDGTIYIFAFKNPSPYSAEIQDIYKSIKIAKSTAPEQKSRYGS